MFNVSGFNEYRDDNDATTFSRDTFMESIKKKGNGFKKNLCVWKKTKSSTRSGNKI